MKHGASNMIPTEFEMETAHIPTTQKGSPCHFIRYEKYCSLWFHSTRPNSL